MINGGFFVLEPSVIDRIVDDSTVWGARAFARFSCR